MYYDLHSHILPAVDDGPTAHSDAIEMARVAAEDGTSVMLTTPHRRDVTDYHSVAHIKDLLASMSDELQAEGIDLTLLTGMENHLDLEFPEDLEAGTALPINGSKYALVELPFFGYPNYVEEVLFKLQLQGVIPVLAHPERIEAIQEEPQRLVSFVERGMLSQVTAGSIRGRFGGKVKSFTHSLLRRNLVHVISSDTHTPSGLRSPKITRGFETAAEIVGRESATLMVVDTPKAIIENEAVEVAPPTSDSSPKRWWYFWRS